MSQFDIAASTSTVACAEFRFYAELNRFLAPNQRQHSFVRALSRDATAKHMIEALGVPHTEVEWILINGAAAEFSRRLAHGDRVSVFPWFSNLTIGRLSLGSPEAPGEARFIADAHLGQLAKNLRMLGFDVLYRNDYSDAELARIAAREDRVALTRDRGLLIRKEIVRGCYLHEVDTERRVAQVIARFGLAGIGRSPARSFSRCMACNGALRSVEKSAVAHRVPPRSREAHERFFECAACARVYWEGSHVRRMRERIARMLNPAPSPD